MNKNSLYRIWICSLCFVMLLYAAGCAGGSEELQLNAAGRFVERIFSLPDEIYEMMAIQALNNGKIRIITEYSIMETEDYGATWAEPEWIPSFFAEKLLQPYDDDSEIYYNLRNAAIDKDGNMLFILTWTEKAAAKNAYNGTILDNYTEYIYVSHDGTEIIMDIQGETYSFGDIVYYNCFEEAVFTADGNLLLSASGSSVYLVDIQTGERIRNFGTSDEEAYLETFATAGNKVILKYNNSITTYDLHTGKVLETEPALDMYLSSVANDFVTQQFIMTGTDEMLYFFDRTGIYQCQPGASQVELVVNGDYNTIADPEYYFTDMIAVDSENIIVTGSGQENSVVILHYAYDKTAAAGLEKELTIFALWDSTYLRQLISDFRSEYPEYYVKLRVGFDNPESVTYSDAVSLLNSQQLTAEGPDLIVLDGLPIETYAEAGLLLELSDLLNEAAQEQEFFENIVCSGKTEAGVFGVPIRFYVPVISGEQTVLEQIENISDLSAWISEFGETDIQNATGYTQVSGILEVLYELVSNQIADPDSGVISEAMIYELLQSAELIYSSQISENKGQQDSLFIENGDGIKETGWGKMYALNHHQQMEVGMITDLDNYGQLISVSDYTKWEYSLIGDGGGKLFIPALTLGINALTDNTEGSIRFVSYMLSADVQEKPNTMYVSGLPVSRTALDKLYAEKQADAPYAVSYILEEIDENGEVQYLAEYDARGAYQEEYERLTDEIGSLAVSIVSNDTIRYIVLEEGSAFLRKEQDLEYTVGRIVQTLELYLGE